MDEKIRNAGEMVLDSDRVVAFTGAGVSTESGIPDFRSPGGIWDKYDSSEFTYQNFRKDPGAYWKRRLEMREESDFDMADAEPNPAHIAIAELEEMGKLSSVITQNIDTLHEKAGNSEVIKLHGTSAEVKCLECGRKYKSEFAWEKAKGGELPPKCECGGTLKSDTVLFGESLPQDALQRAREEAHNCDLMLVVGSSLVVQPAASIPRMSQRGGAKLCIVNLEPTPMDGGADVAIHGKAGEVLPEIMDFVRQGQKG